jgi:hypothetical protein
MEPWWSSSDDTQAVLLYLPATCEHQLVAYLVGIWERGDVTKLRQALVEIRRFETTL